MTLRLNANTLCAVLAIILSFALGCAPAPHGNFSQPLKPGDQLQISFSGPDHPPSFRVTIDAEGNIELPFSKIHVAGLSIPQAGGEIYKAYHYPTRINVHLQRLP